MKEAAPFISVPNNVICDPELSLSGKAVYVYILSIDTDILSSEMIAEDMNCSVGSIQKALKELQELGYLIRERIDGYKMKYILKR